MPSTAIDFHRLVIHFGVALLMFAALLQALAVWRRSAALMSAARACLFGGAAGASVAALLGFLASSEFRSPFLETHESLGFATAAWSVVVAGLWLWKPSAEPRSRGGLLALGGLCLAAGLVGVTGYFGGHMAHGHGAHGPFAGNPPAAAAAVKQAEAAAPGEALFRGKCSICHPAEKALEADVTPGNWAGIVHNMAGRSGGAITAADEAEIVRYLESRASAAGTTTASVPVPPR